jgi:hypothetical protein
LPDKYRTPIVLCYFEGLTHDEAASRLGWPLGTVKGRLARARELLRRRLTRRGVTLSAAALASQLAISDGHAAVPAALQLTTLTAARALAGHVGASLAATSMISMPVSTLVEGVLQAMFANQVKAIALPLLLVAGTVATGITVGATQLGGGAGSPTQAAPEQARSRATRKAQGHPPNAQPTAATSKSVINLAKVSPELVQELNHAATLFDRLLSALRDPKLIDIDRLEQWSALTLQAQQTLVNARADRLAAAEAHHNRVKKLHLLIANLLGTTDQNNGLLKFTLIKLSEADQILAAEKEDKTKEPVNRSVDAEVSASTPAPQDAPNGDVSPVDLRADDPAKNSIDPTVKRLMAAAAPPAADGTMGRMGTGMGAMMAGMMGRGVDRRDSNSADLANRQMRPQIAALAASLAASEGDTQSKVVLKKLDEPISMSFAAATPLNDVLKYIKQATTTASYSGIPIYIDPKGLKESTATLESPVILDLEGVPLKTTLRLMLKQIGLAYCVRDGVLIVSSAQGVNEELKEAFNELKIAHPDAAGGFDSNGNFVGGMGGMR